MAELFWLHETQWAASSPCCPTWAASLAQLIAECEAGSCTVAAKACAGGRYLTHGGIARPCSTASTGGASAAYGRSCSRSSSPTR